MSRGPVCKAMRSIAGGVLHFLFIKIILIKTPLFLPSRFATGGKQVGQDKKKTASALFQP